MLPLSDREKRWGWAILVAFLLCIILPYAWAWAITPQGYTWGGQLFSVDDQNVHLAWARQARDGAFFTRDLFTTEGLVANDKPLFVNGLLLIVGWLSRLSGIEVAFWYHIVRVAGAAWALWQLHLLSWEITGGMPERENARLGTLALAAFTTGVGVVFSAIAPVYKLFIWIDRLDGAQSLFMPEAFFLLSALLYPLSICALGLLLLIIRHILNGQWWAAALGGLALSNIHTYDALPLMAITLIWAIANFRQDRAGAGRALAALVGAGVAVAYQLFVFKSSQEFQVKAVTTVLPLSITGAMMTMLPLLILAIVGWFGLDDQRRARNLLALWALTTALLVQQTLVDISFGRKMLEGWQLPLLLLGGVGWASLKRPFVPIALGAILVLAPIWAMGIIMANAATNNAVGTKYYVPPLYLRNSEVAALRFLDSQPEEGAVLCLPFVAAYVPRTTGKYTYAGHWSETLYMTEQKLPTALRYFKGEMTDNQARALLRDHKILWVVEGTAERESGGVSASTKLGLKPIFRAGQGKNATVIYAAH